MADLELSCDEVAVLAPVLAAMSARAKRPVTLDRLLAEWRAFVREVEAGYRFTIYDFTNDLGTRELIAEIMAVDPDDVGSKLERAIESDDARFRAATLETEQPVVGKDMNRVERWWRFRVPRAPGPELQRDLAAEGITLRIADASSGD